MSGRRRNGRLLAARMTAAAGVPVEVRWEASGASAHRARRWSWHVTWSDGPTVTQMRQAAAAAVPGTGLAVEDLVWQRIVQARAWALAMIREVRSGRPARGRHRSLWLLGDQLWSTPYPERGTAEEVELADRLVRLGRGLEDEMAVLLDAHGLAVLTGEITGGNVVALRPSRPVCASTRGT